jgi:predicted negative regulator of RcsB-dependent stress response
MSNATQTQDPTIEQTLNKTDLGHVIYENRKIFFALIIAVLVGATGYVLWKQVQKSNSLENSVKVFEFQSGIWTDVKSGKTSIPELMKSFEALDSSIQTAPVMIPVALEMSKFLFDKGNLAEADLVLSKLGTSHKHAVSSFFVSMQRAVVLEKLGKIDEAIAMIEPLAQGKEVLMPAKVSVELGRLYLVKGEKGKAQTQFDYVLSTFPNDEQAKLAKLYLAQIAK